MKMKNIEKKRKKEQYVVKEMIRLYCRKNHEGYDRKTGKMCPVCRELSDYAELRKNVRLWRRKPSAATAGFTAISLK